MSAPRTTVCIVPRERFSSAVSALESLLDDPDAPQRIVCVDGGSPAPVRDELARLASSHDLTLLRTDHFLIPNQARNLALRHVDTEFTALLDNDVFVSPGWLPRLEAVADEQGAAVVAPMYGVATGDRSKVVVHLAGAANHLEGPQGRRTHHMDLSYEGGDPAELAATLTLTRTEQAELHLYFARTDALRAAGPLDEALKSMNEHLDLSLRIQEAGGTIWLAPDVLATYVRGQSFTLAERRYYLLRWSRRWNELSSTTFIERWGIDPADKSHAGLLRHGNYKRVSAYRPYRSPIGRVKAAFGRDSMPLPDHTIGRAVAWLEDRRIPAHPRPRLVHQASWDHER